jgi:DNA-binding transcriptional MerR regulator
MPLDKSPDAFRTISEVADDLDVPQHVLRFWETRFSQIKPLKRGGGRRYYRPDDVDLLRGLKRLLYGEGYTIKGVQRILKERGPRHVIAIARGAPIEAEMVEAAPAARPAQKQPAMRAEPSLAGPSYAEASHAGFSGHDSQPHPAPAYTSASLPRRDDTHAMLEPERTSIRPVAGAETGSRLRAALFELSEARERLVAVTSPAQTGEDAA